MLHAGSNVPSSAVLIDVSDGTTIVADADSIDFDANFFDVVDSGGGNAAVNVAANPLVLRLGVGAAASGAEIVSVTGSGTIASGASAVWNAVHMKAATATLTGSTNITTATGFNFTVFEIPTLSAASALTVTSAATVTILGAPAGAGAGPATITNAYALWVQAGTSRFGGPLRVSDESAALPGYSFSNYTGRGFTPVTAAFGGIAVCDGSEYVRLVDGSQASYGIVVSSVGHYGWNSGSLSVGSNASPDLLLFREAAATMQMGADANGAAVAQTLKAHDGITGTDVAGANLTLAGGRGTGAGAVGNLILSTSTLLASGTTAQTLSARVTITGTTITTTLPILAPDGLVGAPSWSLSSEPTSGLYRVGASNIGVAISGSLRFQFNGTEFYTDTSINFGGAVKLARNGTGVLEQVDGTTPQEYRVFGTTSGTKCLRLQHDGTYSYVTTIGTGSLYVLPSGASSETLFGAANVVKLTLGSSTLTFADALDMVFNATAGTKIGTATSQKIGFWNATPVVQQVGGVTVTNNVTAGGTTNQLDDFTSLTVYATDAAAIRNDIYQLGRKMKLVTDALRTIGALQNADA